MIFAEHSDHLLRLGGLGEGGEAAQVAEQDDDVAAVVFEDRLAARRDDRLHDLRRQKPLQPADPLDFVDLRRDPLLKLRFNAASSAACSSSRRACACTVSCNALIRSIARTRAESAAWSTGFVR